MKDGSKEQSRAVGCVKKAAITGVFLAAGFGLLSAGALFFVPEKISKITESFVAFGAKDYKLPDPPLTSANSESDLKAAKSFSKVFANIAKQAKPALVFIETEKKVAARNPFDDFFFFPFQPPPGGRGGGNGNGNRRVQQGLGSGFIFDLKNGYVITNNHVIDGADDITVSTFDDRKFKAKVVGTEKSVDVGILKLEGFSPNKLSQVSFADSDTVEVGDWVLALGAPFGLRQTLTVGVVSAVGRNSVIQDGIAAEDFIQTDAAINPGNSGGPLLNIDGQVIGINSAIYSQTGSFAGIGLAVPSNMARNVAEVLVSEGKVARGFLGISMESINTLSPETLKSLNLPKDPTGVLIRSVVKDSPADQSGLKPYDIIQSLNSASITNANQLRSRISLTKPNSQIKLGILRDGKPMEVGVKIGVYNEEAAQKAQKGPGKESASPEAKVAAEFGVTVRNLTPDLRRQLDIKSKAGVVIASVEDGTPAAEIGLQRGDVITEINRREVKGVRDVETELTRAKEKSKDLLFLIEREGRNQLVVFRNR